MKFSAERETILAPLQAVIGVVERRQTMPILANVLVVGRGEQLSITATDLEVELVARTNVSLQQAGDVTLPGRKLLDIVRALPEKTQVTVSIESEKATIRSGKSRFTLATLNLPPLRRYVVGSFGVHPGFSACRFDLLPKWRAGLEIIHQELGGCKSRFAVRRRRHDEHNIFAGLNTPVPMNDSYAEQRPPGRSFGCVSRDLGFRHVRIMFKRERCYRFAVLGPAANSGKCNERADVIAAACKLRRFHAGVKRLALQTHCRCHKP